MTQGYQVQILRIFSFNLYQSWSSTGNIWLLLRAMKQQSWGCQKHCCRHLIKDPGSQLPIFFWGCVGVLALVLPSMGNHHHRQWFSRWIVKIFFIFIFYYNDVLFLLDLSLSLFCWVTSDNFFLLLFGPLHPFIKRLLREACINDKDLFSAFLNRLFNTLSWTMTEFSVSIREMQEKFQVCIILFLLRHETNFIYLFFI